MKGGKMDEYIVAIKIIILIISVIGLFLIIMNSIGE